MRMTDLPINMLDAGAVGDGVTDNTALIQKTIDAHTAEGAVLYFPKGVYRTGTFFLRSHITLHLDAQAVLSGDRDISAYRKKHRGCIEAPSFDTCLIYAEGAEHIGFAGEGTVDGNGAAFEGERPMLIRLVDCRNVKIRDVLFKNSGSWCCHMISCKDIHIDSLRISNHVQSNNDGLDFDSCQNGFISNTDISSGDDAICLKSTTQIPCENIVISNCILESDTAAVKFGTSSLSGFRNIAISNCVMKNCTMGTIKLILVDGGILENVNISNIVMDRVGSPLFVRVGRRNLTFEAPAEMDFWGKGTPREGKPGIIRNILISDVQANVTVLQKDRTPMMITGLHDSPVKDITLRNIRVRYPGGGTAEDAARTVAEDEYRYPEQWFFGVLPAYGLYARHVDGLIMDQVRFSVEQDDAREAVVLVDTQKC